MAAGVSSRFAPLSYEKPKALITVNGEVLIERQIRQLREVGINEIVVVVGYKKEQFYYLKEKFGVIIVENPEYNTRNNNASIYVAQKYIHNSYICSADNYFTQNQFTKMVEESFYSVVYSNGKTDEWCVDIDNNEYITGVKIGGENSWYMLGHVFWSESFSEKFLGILNDEYNLPQTKNLLWESIYINHIDELKMKVKKYDDNYIFEFDTLDELRKFDKSYINDTKSKILKKIAKQNNCIEKDIVDVSVIKDEKGINAIGFQYKINNEKYSYYYSDVTEGNNNEQN
ncbi:MAG: NTP transferase domain-containing protein [Ruminococcus sp.]|nr:NTP transferase domain-containing protein [Ruminococcus sp.]MEE0005709.1 NTP transferase domain-containing protein [Ruminococcus sp.]